MPLPAGTVTFLFTDVEGSTNLWEQQPDAMRSDLAHHDALLRSAIETNGGSVFKTVGDAFHAAFRTSQDALQAAVEAQLALQAQLPLLPVRMAVHHGTAEIRDADYFGPALNRVARLRDAAHGGQILVSEAIAEQLKNRTIDKLKLQPLGRHRLRDLAAREAIFQLFAPGLRTRFLPPETVDVTFRRGARRAATVAAAVIAMLSLLSLAAVREAHRADRAAAREARQRRRAEGHLYAAHMLLAYKDWEEGNVRGAQELLFQHRRGADEVDLRGFEWRHLWRLCQGESRLTCRGNRAPVNAVLFSPDGRSLVSGSDDGSVSLWDPTSHRTPVSFQVSTSAVRSVAASPDGKLLATAGADGNVCLWETGSRRKIAVLSGHKGVVAAIAFSPDGSRLASGGFDRKVKLWDPHRRRLLQTLSGHGGNVLCVLFSPDGRTLVSGSRDMTIRLWDVRTGREECRLQGHTARVTSLAFSPDGRVLASGSRDGSIRLWDLALARTASPRLPKVGGRSMEAAGLGEPRWVLQALGSGDGAPGLPAPGPAFLLGHPRRLFAGREDAGGELRPVRSAARPRRDQTVGSDHTPMPIDPSGA